jgi:hypothetical protein
MSLNRLHWLSLIILTCVALPACQTVSGGPDAIYREKTNFTEIRDAINTRCLNVARQTEGASELQIVRNDLVTAYMLAADIEYGRYEAGLLDQVRNNNFAASLSILTLTAVATVSGDPELARGFSTAAGLVAGGQKAYTTDQLLNQTISVLQQQMRASRAAQRARILEKLGEPYQTWTFCLAFQDAQAYERAGTLNAALADISAAASDARRINEAAADAVSPVIPYGRDPVAAALRTFVFPTDRALWPQRLALITDLIQTSDIYPQPNMTVLRRRSRILAGGTPELQAARRQLIQDLIADARVDSADKGLLQAALNQ